MVEPIHRTRLFCDIGGVHVIEEDIRIHEKAFSDAHASHGGSFVRPRPPRPLDASISNARKRASIRPSISCVAPASRLPAVRRMCSPPPLYAAPSEPLHPKP